ncbi:lycopene cyclase family protein [Lacihabitans soyangensis]|uniref:Lycopene cyclase n=1 Tax=Lacihabitans soyangensis TaxID=869394 RepID=A0AAE3H0B3_9BACT|nr:lycopene cyclase family protein [Lacihabitans soyangensis]MCP9762602.1 lycopene cyclase [Lacihabitans soyangensis]
MNQKQSENNMFDYIICGGGMSGLSLAYQISLSKVSDKKILIIDPERKTKNDRTWAFWEKIDNPFDQILFKKWQSVKIVDSHKKEKIYDLGEYSYKLLRGIDFYNFVNNHLDKFPNIIFCLDKVNNIQENTDNVEVETVNYGKFSAQYVFDSTFKLNLEDKKNHNLLQHFKGLVIETKENLFEKDIPDMMNFGVPQKDAECRFMYVLPFTKNRAIIEFTVFSEKLLSEKEYDESLFEYLKKDLKLTDYKILEEEFGIIPMSDTETQYIVSNRIIRIGTAGGATNPATGYTFSNTQKKLKKIVSTLEKGQNNFKKESFWQKRHLIYASTLLNVIKENRHPMAEVFDQLFAKNPISQVFKFLDGETTLWEEIKIMWSTPKVKFGMAFLNVISKKLKNSFL